MLNARKPIPSIDESMPNSEEEYSSEVDESMSSSEEEYSSEVDESMSSSEEEYSSEAEPIVINPTQRLDQEQEQSLTELTSESPAQYFEKSTLSESHIYESDANIPVVFSMSMFKRPCKKPIQNQHYEVLSHDGPVGEGRSPVFGIAGTLKKQDGKFIYKDRAKHLGVNLAKKHVVKIIEMPDDAKKDKIQKEYALNNRASHLGMKPPAYFEKRNGSKIACLVMNRLMGKDLFDVIIDDIDGINTLNSDQRIDLCIALLEALDLQVHQKGLVHRDIKPENIKVLFEKDKIKVDFFDFDLSKFSEESDAGIIRCGTLSYLSPEMWSQQGTTYKSDIHAMSLVFGDIFHADTREDKSDNLGDIIINYKFGNLFDDIDDISHAHQKKISALLFDMYEPNVEKRYTTAQALNVLNEIKAERLTPTIKARR